MYSAERTHGERKSRTVSSGRRKSAGSSRFRRVVEQRSQVVRAPYPSSAQAARRRKPSRTGMSAVIYRLRNRPAEKAQYFDFELLIAVVFLMCFGLVMLYSTSAYEAQTTIGDDMYYFFQAGSDRAAWICGHVCGFQNRLSSVRGVCRGNFCVFHFF